MSIGSIRGIAGCRAGRFAYLAVAWVLATTAGFDLVRAEDAGSTTAVGPDTQGLLVAERDLQFELLGRDIAQRGRFERLAAETFRPEALILASDRDPADVVCRRTRALHADLSAMGAKVGEFAAPLAALDKAAKETPMADQAARRKIFDDLQQLRRQIAFRNPLLDFQRILFIKRHRSVFNHMCDQYYGITARPGGGLYVLESPFTGQPGVTDVLARSLVANGRLQGQALRGGNGANLNLQYDGVSTLHGDPTSGGSFLSPALSPDGRQVMFAYVECTGEPKQQFHTDPGRGHWDQGRCYHLFRVNLDGSDLRQITDGTWNDFDPCWLPNGRVAFISERRGGYLRCGRACPLYTLYDMAADGSGINVLSFHDSNEWAPSVAHDGRIVWTRWDYVDRHGCTAHVPWLVRPDGTDPRSLHGNFSMRHSRPDMEVNVRAIPGSRRYVATAAPHHGQAFGSLVVIDPDVTDDDAMAPLKRLTPEVGFPESQGGQEVFGTPWPLGENYHLCVIDASVQAGRPTPNGRGDHGIYLIDAFGNRELLYRDPEIACLSPIPVRLVSLPRIAAAAVGVDPTKPVKVNDTGEGTMAVTNVYDTMRPWPEDAKVTELRIWQLLPCSVPSGAGTPHQTGQRIAEAGDSIVPARWVIGTVPVESDGSAHFKVPAYRELFFQLLDERGMAVQSMRSATSVRHGEHLVCAGCHEPKSSTARPPLAMPLALRRPASVPKPDVEGSKPFSYPRLVQPVLDRHCVQCHEEKKADGAPNLGREPVSNRWYASYHSLVKFGFTSYGATRGWSDPLWYRTEPGKFGARASKLLPLLEKGHHDVKLPAEDLRRLTLWMDACSMFYGVFEKEAGEAQLRGEPAAATLE